MRRATLDDIEQQTLKTQAQFHFRPAAVDDVPGLAALHTAVAEDLTNKHGRGPWSSKTTEKGVAYAMRTSRVFVALEDIEIMGTLRLTTKKPWAIDTKYFLPCTRPVYLQGMAVTPARQNRGIGRWCLEEAKQIAKAWPADAIRLDAYDAKAGAGPFYARCGWIEVGRAKYRNTPLVYFEHLLMY
jgi:GNAT superfamily N-acetyltransferase